MKKFAIILSGCGVNDGTEIHEAVATFLAIKRNGADYFCFAPDKAQHHVIDHSKGQPADDETRSTLMPVNKKYPLQNLLSACRDFPLPNRRKITFEYILIKGLNDSDQDAMNLVTILSGLRAKINLIPLNPFSGSDMSAPSLQRITQFQEILLKNHFTAIIRKSKGQDIMAACGQLSGDCQKMGRA